MSRNICCNMRSTPVAAPLKLWLPMVQICVICRPLHVLLACLSRMLVVFLSHVWCTGWPSMLFIPSCQVPHAHRPARYAVLSPHAMYRCLPGGLFVTSFTCFAPACQRQYLCLYFMHEVLSCPPSGCCPATLAAYLPASHMDPLYAQGAGYSNSAAFDLPTGIVQAVSGLL